MKYLKLFESKVNDRKKIESSMLHLKYYFEDEGFLYQIILDTGKWTIILYKGHVLARGIYKSSDEEYYVRKNDVERFIRSDDFLEFIDRMREELNEFNITFKDNISMGPGQWCNISITLTKNKL